MLHPLPEWAYNLNNWGFTLTEIFDKYAKEQWLTVEATKSLKAELEQFYWPGKKLNALAPYMKNTIERKVDEARRQLASATQSLKWVIINQEPTTIPVTQKTPPTKDNPSIQNVLFWKLWETIKSRNDALKNI